MAVYIMWVATGGGYWVVYLYPCIPLPMTCAGMGNLCICLVILPYLDMCLITFIS